MAALLPQQVLRGLHDYPRHRPNQGAVPFFPTCREDMDALGWDQCDVILVTGDAYVDHPSFGMALVGRLLESHGFRVGVLAQPDWHSADAFRSLGRPALYFGITGGNMDSMVNRYTSDKKVRNDDAYTPNGVAGARPDRAVLVYANRCREAYSGVPLIVGGIEASLRRIAHYDYWSNKIRRSILVDSRADLLLYGNAERALVEVTHRLAGGEEIGSIQDVRGTAFVTRGAPEGWQVLDSTAIEEIDSGIPLVPLKTRRGTQAVPRELQVIRLPSFEQVMGDKALYAHASRILHQESNPHNARALLQGHGDRDVWLTPPPLPLSTAEMDSVYELPYARIPHPKYGEAKIPAYQMIRFSVTALRGCFGGCTFCSITEHEGRIIQNRSETSLLREIEQVRDKTPGFTGVISDIGGPTANMYRLACKSREIEAACRKPSCVFPDVCNNLNTDHQPLINLYRKARALRGVKKVLIASGLRYDLAVRSPEYVRELATHHVGGYLKIAPEHTESEPLNKMMKPGIDSYDRFATLFNRASERAGKKQYLIPYFIAAHPGTTDEDMLNLALWLKKNGFKADQVQAFLPSPMASATAMYYTERNPLRSLKRKDAVVVPRDTATRRLHKAFLRYHDPTNWPLLRKALHRMNRAELIGHGTHCLIPPRQPHEPRGSVPARSGPISRGKRFATQHTGLPPRGPQKPTRS